MKVDLCMDAVMAVTSHSVQLGLSRVQGKVKLYLQPAATSMKVVVG